MRTRTLRKLIEGQITSQIERFREWPGRDTRKDAFDNIVVLAGNGLTRLSGYALDVGDQSWDQSVRKAWHDTRASGSFEALKRQGKSLPEIFNLLVRWCMDQNRTDKPLDETAYCCLWRSVEETELRQLKDYRKTLNFDILSNCSAVITTNYDRMFEAAFVGGGERTAKCWVPQELYPANWKSPSFWHSGAIGDAKVIYKIHGTFLEPNELSEPAHLETAIKDFEQWWDNQDYRKTIARSDRYKKLAYEMSSRDFKIQFRPVLKLLNNPNNLIACIGLGLGGEEHVISRLLSNRNASPAPILKLNIASSLELDPGESIGIYPINVDVGLACSPERRYIATATFLSCLFRVIGNSSAASQFETLAQGRRPRTEIIWPNRTTVAESVPLAIAFGQTSVNRVIGIKEPPTQEQAFAANIASASPNSEEPVELHTPLEIGGQSVVPCIVWDALRMPCMIVSGIGDDALGDFALSEFGKTEFLNFDQVHQLVAKSADQPTRTDHLTVITWAGLRTIFENDRAIHNVSYKGGQFYERRVIEARKDARLLYLTKVGWDDWKCWTKTDVPSLIVFDTGGGACPEQTAKISSLNGLVVASALASVGEMMFEDFQIWRPASKVFWTMRFPEIDHRITMLNLLPTDDRGRLGDQMKIWKEAMLPADETGRAHQNLWFLNCIRRPELINHFLSTTMNRSPAYAVTLGEHGIVYWLRTPTGWSSPSRVWVDIGLGEVRSGLECGDCTRGGIAAALIALSNDADLQPTDYEVAFAFGAWCGTTKVRFFKLWDYHHALREQAPRLLDQVKSRSTKAFGKNETNLELLLNTETLNDENLRILIAKVIADIKDDTRASTWAKDRGMTPTRRVPNV